MTHSVTATADELAALRAEIEALKRTTRVGYVEVDPEMAEEMDQPPRTIPATAIEKMQAAAKRMGGVWNERADWRTYKACRHRDPSTCPTCWTKENEARWEYAVGLRDEPGPQLDEPEELGSQKQALETTKTVRDRMGRAPKTG